MCQVFVGKIVPITHKCNKGRVLTAGTNHDTIIVVILQFHRRRAEKTVIPDTVRWNLRMVGAASGKGASASDTIKVAVMDSGIDYMDYANVEGHINLVDEEKYIPEYFEDVTGHGTAV